MSRAPLFPPFAAALLGSRKPRRPRRRRDAGSLGLALLLAAALWFGGDAGCAKEEPPPSQAKKETPAEPAPDKWLAPITGDSVLARGQEVWKGTCRRCHEPGLVGAPRIASADWGPRVSKGLDTLIAHALQGFEGKTGTLMPAKGGNSALSDEEVTAAVRFMVSQYDPDHPRP